MTISYSLFKYKFKKSIAESIYNEVITKNARYYHWLGKENTWTDFLSPFIPSSLDDTPGAPSDNFRYELHVRRDMLYFKAVKPSDVSYIVPRYDWTTGQVYDMYDDAYSPETPAYSGAVRLEEAKFYVITSAFNVYKCIDNNYNAVSTQVPSGTSMEVFRPGDGSDGYKWKFMYTIPIALRTKFLTSEFIPVSTALTSQFYANGAIIQVETTTSGSGYRAEFTGGTASFTGTISGTTLTVTSMASGAIGVGQTISGTGVTGGTTITALVSGTGQTGTYTVSASQTVSTPTLIGATVSSTIVSNINSTTVTGNAATKFQQWAAAGMRLKTAGGAVVGVIQSVDSQTQVTLTTRALTTAASLGYKIIPTVATVTGDGFLAANPKVVSSIAFQNTVTAGSFIVGTKYKIISTGSGSTNFTLIGSADNNVGTVFTATGIGSGTGSAYEVYNTSLNPGEGYATGTLTGTFSAPTITTSGLQYTATGTATVSATTAAVVTGSIATTVLTVTAVTSGTLGGGQVLTGTNVTAGTRIMYQITSTAPAGALGSTGTYKVSVASTAASTTVTASTTKISATTLSTAGYGYEYAPTIALDPPFTGAVDWGDGVTYALDAIVKYLGNYYVVSGAGQVQSVPPTHVAGELTYGGILGAKMTFIGRQAAVNSVVNNSLADLDVIISGGSITGVTINNGGVGFSNASIVVTGPSGTGAVLTPMLETGNVDTLQANVEQLAIKGSIETIIVVDGGGGFSAAEVEIKGDGTGATATATVEFGKVTRVDIVNKGTGYTWTDIVITGNTGAGGAIARAIMSPLDGHGKNAVDELNANSIAFYSSISKDILNNIEVTNDYRKAGLIKNPEYFNTTSRYDQDIGSGCIYITGNFNPADYAQDMLLQKKEISGANYKNYRIVEIAEGKMIVSVFNNFTISPGDILVNPSNVEFSVTSVQERTVDQFSGELLFLTVREKYAPTSNQLVTLKTIVTI